MIKITNTSHNPQRFTARTGRRVEIAPGASDNVALDADDLRVAAKVRAGLIKVEEQRSAPKKAEPKPDTPAVVEPVTSTE